MSEMPNELVALLDTIWTRANENEKQRLKAMLTSLAKEQDAKTPHPSMSAANVVVEQIGEDWKEDADGL